MVSHPRIGSNRQAAGTRTAAACCTGGIRIVFRVKLPRTTTAASRFPGCAGRPTRPTTSGGRRRPVIPRTMVSGIATSRTEAKALARGPRRAARASARAHAGRPSSYGRSLEVERGHVPGPVLMMAAFLFPGQSAQVEGLLHQLPEHPEVTRTIEEASEVLGLDIDALDSAEALRLDCRRSASAADRRRRHGTGPDGRTRPARRRRRHVDRCLRRRPPAARCPSPTPCRSSVGAAR